MWRRQQLRSHRAPNAKEREDAHRPQGHEKPRELLRGGGRRGSHRQPCKRLISRRVGRHRLGEIGWRCRAGPWKAATFAPQEQSIGQFAHEWPPRDGQSCRLHHVPQQRLHCGIVGGRSLNIVSLLDEQRCTQCRRQYVYRGQCSAQTALDDALGSRLRCRRLRRKEAGEGLEYFL